jgi:hypothetical protein
MRYLKSFNESLNQENISEIISTCEDIMIELSDLGYNTLVDKDKNDLITCSCDGKINSKTTKDILLTFKSVHERLIDYMHSQGFKVLSKSYDETSPFYNKDEHHFPKFLQPTSVDVINDNILFKYIIKFIETNF